MAESESGGMKLPSREEIATLPRRARIAFAARCARRVQPLFKHFWPDAPQRHVDAVDRAITLAQTSAVSSVSTSELARAVDTARADANAAYANAAYAARGAANAATRAAIGIGSSADAATAAAAAATAADAISGAFNASFSSAFSTERSPRAAAVTTMRRDFELLRVAAQQAQWTDETPVPPEFFGPLWPDGEPEGWPEEAKEPRLGHKRYELIVDGPDGASEEEVQEATQQLIVLLDRLNRASGGRGVRIDDDTNVWEHRLNPQLLPSGGYNR